MTLNNSSTCDIFQINSESPQSITENDIISSGSLDHKTIEILVNLLNEYRNCLAFNLCELGKTNVVEMSVNLKDDEPVVYRPYKLPISEKNKVREMIQELVECDIVRPSTSP